MCFNYQLLLFIIISNILVACMLIIMIINIIIKLIFGIFISHLLISSYFNNSYKYNEITYSD